MAKDQVKTDKLVFPVGVNLPDDEPARAEWTAAAKLALHKLDQKKYSPDSIKSWNRFFDFAQGKTGLEEWSNPKFKNDVEKVAFLFGDGTKHKAEQNVVQLALINRVRESIAGLDKKDALKDETTRMYLETLRTTFIKYTESALYKIGYKFSGVSPDIIRDLSYKKFDDVCLSENLRYDNMNGVRNAYFTAIKNATINYAKRAPIIYNETSRKGFSEDGDADFIIANADTGVDEAAEISKKIDKPYTSRNFDKIKTLIEKALDTLPETQRKIFNLRHFENKSYKDMANELGSSEGFVKGSIFRARQHLTSNEPLLKAAFKTIIGISPKEKVRTEESPEKKLQLIAKEIKKLFESDKKLLDIQKEENGKILTLERKLKNLQSKIIDLKAKPFCATSYKISFPTKPEDQKSPEVKIKFLNKKGDKVIYVTKFRKDDELRAIKIILSNTGLEEKQLKKPDPYKAVETKIAEAKAEPLNCTGYNIDGPYKIKDQEQYRININFISINKQELSHETSIKSMEALPKIKSILAANGLKEIEKHRPDKYKTLDIKIAEAQAEPFCCNSYKVNSPSKLKERPDYKLKIMFFSGGEEKLAHITTIKTLDELQKIEDILSGHGLLKKDISKTDKFEKLKTKIAETSQKPFSCTHYKLESLSKIKNQKSYKLKINFINNDREVIKYSTSVKNSKELLTIKNILDENGIKEIPLRKIKAEPNTLERFLAGHENFRGKRSYKITQNSDIVAQKNSEQISTNLMKSSK